MGALDLQVNGYAGVDFNSDDLTCGQLEGACAALEEDGVEGILATVITADLEAMCRRLARLVDYREASESCARMIKGLHIEGPFLNDTPGFIGAHPAEDVLPASVPDMERLLAAAGGLTKVVTLAPERDAEFAVTSHLMERGICVAAGHCDPSVEQLRGAIESGLRMFTHLGNGCPMEMHRHDNIVQRVLSLREELWISFIPDGAHVPFIALRNYLDLVGLERVVMVTDAIAAARMGPGHYRFLGREVTIGDDLVARSPDGSHLIGSTVTMPQLRRNLAEQLGMNEGEIRRVTEENPLTILGGGGA